MKLYITKASDFVNLRGAELLTVERRTRLEKYNIIEDKQRCLAAGLLLRFAMGESAGHIEHTAKGKPFLKEGPCFNLSHSGEYVILAVSENEVGADIERIGPYKEKLVRRCCTEDEFTWLSLREGTAFYRLWTGKEAVMKVTGYGLSMDPGSFSLSPAEDGVYEVSGRAWYLCWPELFEGYSICIASSAKEDIELVYLSEKELISEV